MTVSPWPGANRVRIAATALPNRHRAFCRAKPSIEAVDQAVGGVTRITRDFDGFGGVSHHDRGLRSAPTVTKPPLIASFWRRSGYETVDFAARYQVSASRPTTI
ncbi:hypothetical protein YM304_23830 [Ilumatobacter coccineus YM16-304]|uniref:Uncharacterized protein n=1 Tax=Ilumatobacter coccineus (strain NBRC 103263 / KCTC 29153 / YM16-304) TaxID=1313172 RepID=A0A6C7E7I3_ILUCY|nr:hypothetical protein YM304_23830 [Ilumatobacter coccineus YM16-304]